MEAPTCFHFCRVRVVNVLEFLACCCVVVLMHSTTKYIYKIIKRVYKEKRRRKLLQNILKRALCETESHQQHPLLIIMWCLIYISYPTIYMCGIYTSYSPFYFMRVLLQRPLKTAYISVS
jgi:hypothetical protein